MLNDILYIYNLYQIQMRISRFRILLLIFTVALGCKTSKNPQAENREEKKAVAPAAPRSINGCYARATILEILPDVIHGNPDNPCSRTPCFARIRIDRVINRGMECDGSVQGGAELKVYFSCSLVQTGEALFPGMNASYPGLEINDKFAATFLTYGGGESEAIAYKVTGYQKIDLPNK